MRVVDVFLAFPAILLALALVAVLGASAGSVIIALALVFWTQYARIVRAATLAEREKAYIEAARAIGAGEELDGGGSRPRNDAGDQRGDDDRGQHRSANEGGWREPPPQPGSTRSGYAGR